MNKLKLLFISTVILFSYLSWLATPVWATQNYQPGSTIFSDNFNNDPTNSGVPPGWTVQSGDPSSWFIDSNKELTGLQNQGQIFSQIGTGGDWDNYRIEVDLRNDNGIDQGIGFRGNDTETTYGVDFRFGPSNGLYQTPEIAFAKVLNGQNTPLFDTHNIPLITQQTYHIKIEAFENHFQMWVDQTLVFDLDDNHQPIKTGGISFSYWTGDYGSSLVRFDNVKVTALSKQLYPVIFIPGIGGSELQNTQGLNWAKDNGYGGVYSNSYQPNETVWFNQNTAILPGPDDYFDILRLKADGQTPEANLKLTGNVLPYTYGDLDKFFTQTDLGYTKNTNYFVFTYDWRKDITTTSQSLDGIIELVKQLTGQPQVNLVAHSMGGLVARNYLADSSHTSKVNKLIELGTPHLGSVDALESLLYGKSLNYNAPYLPIPISVVDSGEIYDLAQNMPSFYELLPTESYSNFYDNTTPDKLWPFFDDRDIDQNQVTGPLNFTQTGQLLANLNKNTTVYNLAQTFYSQTNPALLRPDPHQVKVYEIAGSGQPTLGQIKETWTISWPINLIAKQDEIYINGDGTVPLYSATLKSDHQDLSNQSQIFFVEQRHEDLAKADGAAMAIVKNILLEGNVLPAAQSNLDGSQLSIDNGNLDLYDEAGNHSGLKPDRTVENNIPEVSYKVIASSKQVFVKKTAKKVTAKVSASKPETTTLKVRRYTTNIISQTAIYKKLPAQTPAVSSIVIDSQASPLPEMLVNNQITPPTSVVNGPNSYDNVPPQTTIAVVGNQTSDNTYQGPATITLTPTDSESGTNQTEYSLDNGQTVQTYTQPIVISNPGTTILQVTSTDNAGNQEIPQTQLITIPSPTISPLPAVTSDVTTNNSPKIELASPSPWRSGSDSTPSPQPAPHFSNVLGIKYQPATSSAWPELLASPPANSNLNILTDKLTVFEKLIRFLVILLGWIFLALLLTFIPKLYSRFRRH